MKMNQTFAILASATTLLSASATMAAESAVTVPSTAAPTNTLSTTIQGTEPAPSILDKFISTDFTVYHGGTLNDPGATYTLDHLGRQVKSPTNTTYFDNTTDLAYMVTKDIGVGAYVPFFLVPVQGQHFVIGDVGVEFFDKKTVATDELRVFTNLVLQGPTSDYSQSRKQGLSIKTTPYIWYKIPHTNLKVGSWNEVKAYLDVNSGKTFKLYAEPYVNYALSEHFSLNVSYEMEADHMYGATTYDFTSYQTDLQPGFVWFASPRFILNPYIQIFTGNKVSADTMAVGATISARML